MAKNTSRDMRSAQWSRRTRDADREAARLERLLARAEDLLEKSDGKKAVKAALAELPQGPFLEAAFHVRAGDCHQAIEQLDQAEAQYRQAIAIDPKCADALHGIGLVHQLRGEHEPMVAAWLEVRRLDLAAADPPWTLSVEEFGKAADAAFEELPAEVHGHLENLQIVVCDCPAEDLVREGVDPRSLGIITGVPFSHKRILDSAPELDCVQLYQRNIERMCSSREEVLDEIRITVLHETGHYFGLSDDDLDDIGLG